MPTDFHLSAFLPYRLAVLAERVSRRLSVEYGKTHGLSVAEWRVLVHVNRAGAVSVREIHETVNLEKPRVSRAVARLQAAGLVRKVPGERDGRLVAISLTAAGRTALAQVLPAARAVEARLLSGVSAADLAAFDRVAEHIHTVLDHDPQARARSPLDVLTRA